MPDSNYFISTTKAWHQQICEPVITKMRVKMVAHVLFTKLQWHLQIHSFLPSSRIFFGIFNTLNVNFTKWSNTVKQFVGNLPKNYLSVFDHFVEFVLKGLRIFLVFKWRFEVGLLLLCYKQIYINTKQRHFFFYSAQSMMEIFLIRKYFFEVSSQ